ncbi:MAG: penicillin-binding protein 2 [Actinomycetota bacterium]|nr:penicillin-binding protein 2 [Actinomycetota bacterium]
MACLLLSMTVVFVAIGGRLVAIQGVSADHYLAVGLSQRLTKTTLPGVRGAIFDRQGQELAVSIPQATIWADPQLVTDPQKEAATLAPVLAMDSTTLQSRLRSAGRFVYLARKVDDALAAKVSGLRLPGVFDQPEPKRFLPAGTLALPLLGSVGSEDTGLSGLEQEYNHELSGQPGQLIEERDPKGSQIPGGRRQYRAPVNGQDLVLTIDESLQAQTEQALAAQIGAAKAKSGTAAVMDAHTGELLAVASLTNGSAPAPPAPITASATTVPATPDSRPTCPASVASTGPATTATSRARSTSPSVACAAVPATSAAAFTGVFEPGSVSKLVTISAALQTGVVSPSDRFSVPDSLRLADAVFRDAESHPVENWTVTDILANSSNVGTITIAQRLGKQRLADALAAYGFGQATSVRFPGQSAGLMPPLPHWSATSIGTIAIGQGVAVTAVQMLAAYNSIANGGVYVAPKLVAATVDTGGRTHPTAASPEHRVVSPEVAQQMTTMLGEVVRVGTGQTAKVDGYTVAGKTGTARIPLQGARGYMNGVYTSSFAGFVPAEHPALTSIVVVDQTPYFGAVAAAPVFSAVAGYGLREFRIAPVPPQPPPPGVPLATPATAQAAGETLPPIGSPAQAAAGKNPKTGTGAPPPAPSSPPTTHPATTASTLPRRSGPGAAATTSTSRPAKR